VSGAKLSATDVASIRQRYADGEGITAITHDLEGTPAAVAESYVWLVATGKRRKSAPMVDCATRVLRRQLCVGSDHPGAKLDEAMATDPAARAA
jgi:hypothetical protein